MKKNYKGSIFSQTTSSGKKYLYYKSPYLKNKKTATGLEDNKINRKEVVSILKKIEYKFELGLTKQKVKNDVNNLFVNYIEICRNQKNLQEKTIKSYIYAYKLLIDENFYIDDKVTIKNKEISYIEFLIQKNLSILNFKPTSKNILLRSIGTFVNWLIEEEYIQHFNYKKYKLKEQPKPVDTFTDEEINLILEDLKVKNIKIYYVILFMLLTGTRGKETLEIKFSDINVIKKSLSIPNKIRKDIIQTIPLRESALEIVKIMLEESKKRYKHKEKLFDYNTTSLRYISKVITESMNKFNINKNVKLHAFRKYYATQIVKSGVSPYVAQKLIRHSNIQTTINHYYKQDVDELKEILEKIPSI